MVLIRRVSGQQRLIDETPRSNREEYLYKVEDWPSRSWQNEDSFNTNLTLFGKGVEMLTSDMIEAR
jgi:hypothetical protein